MKDKGGGGGWRERHTWDKGAVELQQHIIIIVIMWERKKHSGRASSNHHHHYCCCCCIGTTTPTSNNTITQLTVMEWTDKDVRITKLIIETAAVLVQHQQWKHYYHSVINIMLVIHSFVVLMAMATMSKDFKTRNIVNAAVTLLSRASCWGGVVNTVYYRDTDGEVATCQDLIVITMS